MGTSEQSVGCLPKRISDRQKWRVNRNGCQRTERGKIELSPDTWFLSGDYSHMTSTTCQVTARQSSEQLSRDNTRVTWQVRHVVTWHVNVVRCQQVSQANKCHLTRFIHVTWQVEVNSCHVTRLMAINSCHMTEVTHHVSFVRWQQSQQSLDISWFSWG